MLIRLERASALSLAALSELFNAGYAGYVVPVNITEGYIAGYVRQHDIALDRSVVAWAGDRPVGFALLGIRRGRGWVAALAVVTDHRKQGVGRLLMQGILESAREAHLSSVQLEVIAGNDDAHKLYLHAGLRDVRRLLILERPPAPVEPQPWSGSLESGTVQDALAAFEALHTSENPWQRQPASLRNTTPPLEARLARRNGVIAAYAIGSFTAERISLIDVGTDPALPDAMAALLASLHASLPQAQGRLVNLDKHDAARPVLEALGYSVPLSQHEMRIDL